MTINSPQFLPAHRIFKDAKPGIRYYKISQVLQDIPEDIPKQSYMDEMKRIISDLGGLMKDAVKLDCQGETEKAMVLFKQLVAAEFDNPYPYLRLCTYYSQQQKPVQVDIVCCCYLKMMQIISCAWFQCSDSKRKCFYFY